MPVTVIYGFELKGQMQANGFTQADATSLANGGLAVTSLGGNAFTELNVFDSTALYSNSSGHSDYGFRDSAIDQLSNGNLVIAGARSGQGWFVITDGAGDIVIPQFNLGVSSESEFDVAALAGGGFAVVDSDFRSGTNFDIAVRIFDNIGANQAYFYVDLGTDADRDASVAALDNGSFAVAWTRSAGGRTQIWYALYDAGGGEIRAPALFDDTGPTNQHVSVTATNGGFAFAYEDNGWGTGNTDISMASFDTYGNNLNLVNLNNPAFAPEPSNDLNPALTRLANGMLAVSFSNNADNMFPYETDYDTYVELIDPVSLQVLASRNVTAFNPSHLDVQNSTLAGFGLGHIAVFHTEYALSTAIVGENLQAVRISNGDAAANTIAGDDFKDFMYGSGGNDTLSGLANNDQLFGGDGDDLIGGGDGDDQIFGDLGNDLIVDGNGADTVDAGGGDDVVVLAIDNTNDMIAGDAGSDILELVNAIGPVTVAFGAVAFAGTVADGGLGTNSFTGIERINGSLFSDLITGGSGGETFFGSDGDDALIGNDGDDSLFGGFGHDTLIGGRGTDTLNGGANTLGGLYNDTADYSQALGGGVTVNLGLAGPQAVGADQGSDTLIGIENLTGSNQADVLIGDGQANGLIGGLGNDAIGGVGGNDFIAGNGGNDVINDGVGADYASGGADNDTIFLTADAAHDTVGGDGGTDTLDLFHATGATAVAFGATAFAGSASGGGLGNTTFTGIERVLGSNFGDIITGGAGPETFFGRAGADTIAGWAGNDAIYGDAGADRLAGIQGADTIFGGADGDTFVFGHIAHGGDTFGDFATGIDEIEIARAGFGLAAGYVLNFQVGAAAVGAGQVFLFNPAEKQFLFDSNGGAGGGVVLLATLSAGSVAAGDIVLV